MRKPNNGLSWAGLVLGTIAVAFNTQAGYYLVAAYCAEARLIVLSSAIASLAVALIGFLLSFPAWYSWSAPRINETPATAAPRGMLAGVSVLAALLFSLVIVLQGAAGLIIHGCQR